MTAIANSNISTIELNSTKCNLLTCYACSSYDSVRSRLYLLPCDDICITKELFLYNWVISSWEQNDNGTTTGFFNYITLSELKNIIDRTKQICGC